MFAVTDRRILDVKRVRTSDGRAVESMDSTLYANVAKLSVSIKGSTTSTALTKLALGS